MGSVVFSTRSGHLTSIGLVVALSVACAPEPASPPPSDPPPTLDKSDVTVSGISAGGYMALQAHVALSDRIGGAGIIAGGPYHCAEGSLKRALADCIAPESVTLDPMLAFTRGAASAGTIAPPDGLRVSRVFLLHGENDSVVSRPVADALAAYYREWVPADRVRYVTDIAAGHGWPTVGTGIACGETGGDYVNACDYDTAGELLTHIYGPLAPATADAPAPVAIDLSQWLADGSDIDGQGFVFVPTACASSPTDCRLHIVFHGCRQGSEFVADRFATGIGIHRWAATNRIVVVYPQVEKSLSNPQGCWDWWGYTGDDYDLRTGKQILSVGAIIDAWARGRLQPASITDDTGSR